jgi:MFS family permease
MKMGKKNLPMKIAILLVGLVPVETGQIVQPALGEIAKAFPQANAILNGLIITLPSLAMIIFSTISGRLADFINKKTLLITGLILYIIGGATPALYSPNITSILVMRAVMGIGAGLVLPLVQGLIAEFYDGGERTSMVGISFAIGSVGGVIMSTIAGYVCLLNWRYVFLLYLLFTIVLFMEIILLPAVKPARETAEEKAGRTRPKLPAGVYMIAAIAFIIASIFNILFQKLPMMIMAENLGSPAVIGIAFAFLTLSAFLTGLVFERIFRVLNSFTLTLAIGIFALSYFLLSQAHEIIMVYAGTFMFGIGMGTSIPYYFTRTAIVTQKAIQTFALGIVNSAFYLGCFTSTFVAALLVMIVAGPMVRQLFMLLSIILSAFVVISIGFVLFNKSRKHETPVVVEEGLP